MKSRLFVSGMLLAAALLLFHCLSFAQSVPEAGKDGWIRMVVRDRAHSVKASEIILVRIVVTMPGYHVKWRMGLLGSKEVTREFGK